LLKSADRRLALHPSGTYFAFPVRNEVRLWPLADGVEVPRSVPNTTRSQFRAVAFHPSGGLLAAGGTDGTVKLYDTATWRVTRAFAWKAGGVQSLCFSADGTRAAAGTATGRIVVWDVD
jgi:WD40 repeat protein